MQYSNGDISKREFLQLNFDYIDQTNCRPFLKVDSYEKGMFNYQYYNGMAKYYRMLSREVRNTKKHKRYYNYYLNLGNNYYHKKDNTALDVLKLLHFENIVAYIIKVDSKALQNQLYEIVITNKDEAIFHSKALWLKDILKDEGVFLEGIRPSVIEEYINERY